MVNGSSKLFFFFKKKNFEKTKIASYFCKISQGENVNFYLNEVTLVKPKLLIL